jgi:hypothetical protein
VTRLSVLSIIGVLLLTSFAAAGQSGDQIATFTDTAPPPSKRFPARWYPSDSTKIQETVGPVKSAPYTAIQASTERFSNPETGKTDVRVEKSFMARDSEGRTRLDTPPDYGHGGHVLAHDVQVQDPVSHCSFYWVEPDVATPNGPTAIVTCLPRAVRYVMFEAWSTTNFNSRRDSVSDLGTQHSEPLGKRVFGEVEAIGIRNTITRKNPDPGVPATTGTEAWYAPAIHELVSLTSFPEIPGGAPDSELTNIHLVEPDPTLFYPPPNYRILTMSELMDAYPPPTPKTTSSPVQ